MDAAHITRRDKNQFITAVDSEFNKRSVHGLPNNELMKIWRLLLADHISDTRMQLVAAEMHSRKILY